MNARFMAECFAETLNTIVLGDYIKVLLMSWALWLGKGMY